jgi:hypothetical protein
LKACEKRPVSLAAVEAVADRVEATLQERSEKEMATVDIGEFVMDELKRLDKVAYVRFASVYRHFRDINEFCQRAEGFAESGEVIFRRCERRRPTTHDAARRAERPRPGPMPATVTSITPRRADDGDGPRSERPFRDNPRLILAGIVVLVGVLVALLAIPTAPRAFSRLPQRIRPLRAVRRRL